MSIVTKKRAELFPWKKRSYFEMRNMILIGNILGYVYGILRDRKPNSLPVQQANYLNHG